MEIFSQLEKYNYEELILCHDKASGLKAIICIHNTTLGPGLGGTRMWNYATEEDAIADVLRLARGMTYKNAVAGLNAGGAKGVIIADSKKDKTEPLLRAYGKFVQSLNGRFNTGEDVGMSLTDLEYISMETDFIVGRESTSGDTGPATAFGVLRGIEACAREVWGSESLQGKTVAIQGLGNVGYALCEHLHEKGAKLIVADINPKMAQKAIEKFGAHGVAPDEIYGVECDIFSPCALGLIINDVTIPQLKCKVIAGSANNQMKEVRHAEIVHEKGILYAPDYVINAGGVINAYQDMCKGNYDRERTLRRIGNIYQIIEQIIAIAKRERISTFKAADILAEERIESIRNMSRVMGSRSQASI